MDGILDAGYFLLHNLKMTESRMKGSSVIRDENVGKCRKQMRLLATTYQSHYKLYRNPRGPRRTATESMDDALRSNRMLNAVVIHLNETTATDLRQTFVEDTLCYHYRSNVFNICFI